MTAAVKLLSLIRCFVGCCLDFLDGAKEARPPETANLKQAKNKQTAMKQKKKKKDQPAASSKRTLRQEILRIF